MARRVSHLSRRVQLNTTPPSFVVLEATNGHLRSAVLRVADGRTTADPASRITTCTRQREPAVGARPRTPAREVWGSCTYCEGIRLSLHHRLVGAGVILAQGSQVQLFDIRSGLGSPPSELRSALAD